MEVVVTYLVKANVIITLLFLAYLLLFKNEKTFNINRAFLSSSLMLALTLPFVPAVNYLTASRFPDYMTGVNPLNHILNVSLANHNKAAHIQQVTAGSNFAGFFSQFNVIELLAIIYVLVAVVLFTRFLFQLFNLFFLFKANRSYKKDGVIYCEHNQSLSPFSFFNLLMVNRSAYSHDQLQQIIAHEKVHIRQRHSVDVLLAELAHVLLWFNPLMILLKRYTKLNLEYIADQGALNTGIDKKQYQLSILRNSLNFTSYPLTNLFNSSKIKLRIKMINQKTKPASNLYKYIFVLPLILMSYFIINPVNAKSAAEKMAIGNYTPLKAFEGIYQNQAQKTAYFKVTAENNTLVAKRLDYDQQFTFTRKSELAFETRDDDRNKTIVVAFTKNAAGEVMQAQVADRDVWVKVDTYTPVKEVKLTLQQLKTFEGKYQFEVKKEAFLTISANADGLTLKKLWDGKEISNFIPIAENEFLNIKDAFPLKFIKDKDGNVIKMFAFTKDAWDKVNE